VVLDAEHRALVGLVHILAQVRHPAYRLVMKADAPFPKGTSENEWQLTRAAKRMPKCARRSTDGCSLFRIGHSLSEIHE
jgi:hypothetical protein